MKKRRTFAQVERAARKDEREMVMAEMCRVLKWHLDQPELADKLDAVMKSGKPTVQAPPRDSGRYQYYSGFDTLSY